MPKFAFLALILSVSAHAGQVGVGPEIISSPLRFSVPLTRQMEPALAVVATQSGFLMTWAGRDESESDRVFVARLDRNASLVPGSVHALPTWSGIAGTNVFHPAIAVIGSAAVVTWVETIPSSKEWRIIAAMRITTDGSVVDEKPVQLVPYAGEWPYVLFTSGDEFWLMTPRINLVFTASEWQKPRGFGAGPGEDAAVNDEGVIGFAAHWRTCRIVLGPRPCGNVSPSCWPTITNVCNYTLQFTSLFRANLPNEFGFLSEYRPSVGAARSQFLVAWRNGNDNEQASLTAARIETSGRMLDSWASPLKLDVLPPDDYSPAQIAGDGDRYLVVWQTRGPSPRNDTNISGRVVHTDGTLEPIFVLAGTASEERLPFVVRVAPGRFLVAYESSFLGDRRLAGRFVDLELGPGRRRPAH